ncbi:MAG TPA: RNA polymerase sigma factor [Puia sp.]|nr:RNA polymerase sigma factor [Puia sp.]
MLGNEVWTRVGSGDQEAFGQLYVFYYKRLYNYGRKMTADIAVLEDALQETLVAVWTGRERLHKVQKPHSYLLQTFRFILFRKLRRDRKIQSLDSSEPGEPDFGREEILIRHDLQADQRRRLEQALQNLTSRQREAIFLRFYEGLSYEEVAGIMNISVKATYKIMSRALHQLKETLSLPVLTILLLIRGLV